MAVHTYSYDFTIVTHRELLLDRCTLVGQHVYSYMTRDVHDVYSWWHVVCSCMTGGGVHGEECTSACWLCSAYRQHRRNAKSGRLRQTRRRWGKCALMHRFGKCSRKSLCKTIIVYSLVCIIWTCVSQVVMSYCDVCTIVLLTGASWAGDEEPHRNSRA